MTDKPKIAIVGYGQMGKEIEALAIKQGFTITDIFDIDKKILPHKKYWFDVAVDFSQPTSVEENVFVLAQMKKNIVLGTTGWQDVKSKIAEIVKEFDIGLAFSSNFSFGMKFFSEIVKQAAILMNSAEGYDIMLHELHHRRKKDSPSGTAIRLAQIVLDNFSLKNKMLFSAAEGAIEENQLHVSSTRGGEIFGTHSVYIDSIADTIELTHRAKNRLGLALGAIKAAQFIHNKKGIFEL